MKNCDILSNNRTKLIIHYTDLGGFLRSVETNYIEAENNEFIASFDGSSVTGFENIESSDLLIQLDHRTLRDIPWISDVKRGIGRIYRPNKKRYEKDPRYVAERLSSYLNELGYRALVGAELEFFVFKSLKISYDNPTTLISYRVKPLDRVRLEKNYHASDPLDALFTYRLKVSKYLALLDYEVEVSHHEVARSQIELSLRAGDPVYISDEIITAKWVAKYVASEMGLRAIFMPKPIYGENGSGMHLHISLWRGDENLFYSPDEKGLSEFARYFIGGLIHHCRSLAALVAPTTNSYKRLVLGYEAPVYCLWGYYNRSVGIRIPVASNITKTRIEFRVPDPSANPYLAVSATLMAGLDGIKKKIDPGEEFVGSAYELTLNEIKERNIKTLPRDLYEALEELENDHEFLKPVFNKELIESFIEIKRRELNEIYKRPHPYEYILYMDI